LAKVDPSNDAYKEKAITLLTAGMKSKEPRIRRASIRGLLDLHAKTELLMPAIKDDLDSNDKDRLGEALEALSGLGVEAVPGLIEALKHESLRPAVAAILGRIGPAAKAAAPALIEVVKNDKHVHARCEALFALGNIGPDVAVAEAAVGVLEDSDEQVYFSACYALGKVGPAAKDAVPALEKKLESKDVEIATAAAWAIAKIDASYPKAAELVPLLAQALSDRKVEVRLEAAAALLNLGPAAKTAAAALQKASHDKDPAVREKVEKALQAIGD
jgi:HEAT repeat protein